MSTPPGTPVPDSELIRRVVEDKDQSALVELFGRYNSQVRGIVQRVIPANLKTHLDVEDCCQELFLTLLDGLRTFDRTRPFEPWVIRVAQHVVRKLCRSFPGSSSTVPGSESASAEHDGIDLFGELSAHLTSPSQVVSREEAFELVRAKLAELRPIDREALNLKYFQEKSDSEAAASLKISRTAYLMRVIRARQMLMTKLVSHQRASWFDTA